MSKGHKLSGAGSNQPQSRTSPSPSGCISSDSQSAILLLTVENVQKLEKEYLTAKGVLGNQSVEEYVKQSNLCLLERERSGEVSGEHVPDKKDPEGAISFLPREPAKRSRETHLEKAEEMSHKGSLLAEFQADSLSTPHAGSKSKESNNVKASLLWPLCRKSADGSSATHRRCEVEDLGTQTEWSYSDKSLASIENAISVIREEKRSREDADGKDSPESIPSQGVVVLFTDIGEEIETQESEEGSEETNQTKSRDEVVRAESDAAGGEDRKSDDEAPGLDSEEAIRDDLKITTLFLHEENHFAEVNENCEFCKAVAKPIPTAEDLDTESLESFLCCRTYKEVFECVIKELMESTSDDEIDIAPHPHLSQAVLESETRKKLEQQLKERGFDKYRELYERHIKFGALTKISFKFSQPQEEVPVVGPALPQTLEDLDTEFRAEHLKNCHARDPVRRYYPDGQKFFLLFPDGTGQVFYPSGNIAILIVYVKEVQFIYIILEDHTYSGIRAFFTNRGYATCYHRNGLIWLNLDRLTGSYFDKKGRRQKHWSWHDFSHHVHAPPFQPICMKLNIYIRIKIVAQEQIYLSFIKQQNCIYFNMGARLKLKDTATLHLLKPAENQLGLLLHSKRIQINSLLAKMKKVLRDLQRTPLNKIQALPLVLAQLCKLLKWRRRKTLAQ
ncbi:glutamate-rich protein 6B isoform X1 [Mauremys reevesii]|uniref:glutamate-rich protein 6B isoform X1 n=1 Tax=Mauremys reevesii TaxID=260615 RepID=UPI00193FA6D8|nr:glutamate-rich protein 6B isoform X1 [Mauremys reevesii]XP_039353055.1 glutamate-rich protein 6B isoform X1 [Mauremys reevesii]XP_039353056.1 glutamate-rich protein 6B isoform X1 [Mauremys reevesii]